MFTPKLWPHLKCNHNSEQIYLAAGFVLGFANMAEEFNFASLCFTSKHNHCFFAGEKWFASLNSREY